MGRARGGSTTPKSIKSKAKMYYQNQNRRGGGGGRGRGGRGGGGYGGSYGGGGGGGRGNYGGKQMEYLTPEFGVKGFMCFCNFNERDCVKESYNLLNEYYEKTGGLAEELAAAAAAPVTEGEGNSNSVDTPVSENEREAGAQAQASASVPPPASSEDDIEAEIAAEVRELNSPSRKYRFQSIQSGARNIVFIRTTIPEPSKLAHAILEDLFTTKQQKSRFLLRILPIDATCFTNLDEIRETARAILPKYFITGLFQSYQIVYKCRYSDKLSRDDVIKCIAEVAQEVNPLSVVDLTNPQLAIIVEIVKNVTCLGVARDFNKFRKYNLIEASGEVPPPAPANTAAAAGADGQEEGGKVEGDDGPGPEPAGEGMEQVSA